VRSTVAAKDAHPPPTIGDFDSIIHEQIDP